MNISLIFKRKIKQWNKPVLICCLSIILLAILNVGNFAYGNNNANNIELNSNNKNLKVGSEIKTNATQEVWFHNNGADYNINETKQKNISFSQTFKQIYVTDLDNLICAKNLVDFIRQNTKYDENCCSGSYFNHDHGYEADQRIQNWTSWYLNNLYIGKIQNSENEWGRIPVNLFLRNSCVWDKESEHKDIKNDVIYGLENNSPKIYKTGRDINFDCGFKKEFWNGDFNIYGIDTSFLKESGHTAVVYSWVNRYLWTLRGENTINEYSSVPIETQKPIVNLFTLRDAIEIKNASWENKTVEIRLNSNFAIEQRMILEEVLADANIMFSYSIPSGDSMKKIEILLDYKKITDGVVINLGKNSQGEFTIQDLNFHINEVVNSKKYIQNSTTCDVSIKDKNILYKDGKIALCKPEFISCVFLNKTENYKNIFPGEVDNKTLLLRHVKVINCYGEIFPGTVLGNDQYLIERDSIKCTVKITILNFDENELLLENFKSNTDEPDVFDISMFSNHEIPSEIKTERIAEFLDLCGYDKLIFHELIFSPLVVDDINGNLLVNGKRKNQNSGRNFQFVGLEKYYCKQISPVEKILPSAINMDYFEKNLIDFSGEFLKRNSSTLKIELFPNDNEGKLTANILCATDSYQFIYELKKNDKNQFFMWFIVSGLILLVGFAIMVWFHFQKKKL